MFILDFGSGNTCQNNLSITKKMIDGLAEVDTNRKCIIKWQLFNYAGDNIPLKWIVFDFAYEYATNLGFKITASVFDMDSLDLLLQYDVPFIKIANRPDLYWLIGEVPRKIPVMTSIDPKNLPKIPFKKDTSLLYCVSKYPANIIDYEYDIYLSNYLDGISDHTVDWELFKKYLPQNYECHFKLPDSKGLDTGPFARTPEQIKEIYNLIK